MDKTKQEDLRVRKTKEAIRRTFEDMICEMDYEKITVKELTDRAMINRKTFYLHYETLDDLLEELQQEIVDSFTSQNISYKSMADINRIKVVLVEKKKTNKWLAEQLGKDAATISKWCTNSAQPSLETLLEIAKVLAVDPRELIVPIDSQKVMMSIL